MGAQHCLTVREGHTYCNSVQFSFECLLLLDGAQCQREGWHHTVGASSHPQLASLQAVQHQKEYKYFNECNDTFARSTGFADVSRIFPSSV